MGFHLFDLLIAKDDGLSHLPQDPVYLVRVLHLFGQDGALRRLDLVEDSINDHDSGST